MARNNPQPGNGYVLYIYTQLQDGHEEGAKCFDKIEDALAYVNKDHWGYNPTFRLFELGKEIPLTTVTEEEPQPAKTKTVYKLKVN